jgi:predicted metalloprotease
MNQRIRELHSQCKVCDKDTVLYFDYERFAELIVQECAGVGYDASYYECALNVSNKIKQHFGVEE